MDVVMLGILGGTFDPVHQGHLSLAYTARRALSLDKVLFVPAGEPPHKTGLKLTPSHQRLKMVELAVADQAHFEISRVDLDRPGPHYAVDTVAHIRAKYGLGAEACFFIIGSDSLIDLPSWHTPAELLKRCRLAVIHRPNYRPDLTELMTLLPGLAERITWVEMPANPISSTALRQQIARGEVIGGVIPPAVMVYIQEMGLYRSDRV